MKGWTKRRVALILALALIASQMSGCKKTDTTNQSADPVSNNNVAVVETTASTAEEETVAVTVDANGWLEENLENIRQSLLEGDYVRVVDILLTMQDELTNDPGFNALLYIAYMGNGNETEAAALLNNPNLDTDAFTDAFLENAEALKGNADMAEIQRRLMEHMLSLGESNPAAYEAVARIGALIQNDDPTDPTAYAARYIAALAAGDEAAAAAILAEAEANGVSAEALTTTAIAYVEEHDLTKVTVEEIEKGKLTSTTYSGAGNVVRVDTTVSNQDGTKTEIAQDKNGVIYGIAQYGADGKIVSRTVYHFELVLNPQTARVEQRLAQVEEQSYSNGIISSLVLSNVNADGNTEPDVKLTFNNQGVISSYAVYEDGEEKRMSSEEISATDAKVVDGELVSSTFPVLDENDKVIGKVVSEYSYHHPAGVIEDRKQYENNKLVMDADYRYSYESGNVEKIDVLAKFYDEQDGSVWLDVKVDYAENTYTEYNPDGSYSEAVMDVTGQYLLTGEVYNDQGVLTERRYAYYTGKEMTSELDVHYDEQGRVIAEITYGVDRKVDLEDPKTIVQYSYEDGRKTVVTVDYDTEGKQVSHNTHTYSYTYDEAGNTTDIVEEMYEGSTWVSMKTTSYIYDEAGRCYYEEVLEMDVNTYEMTGYTNWDFYNGDTKIGTKRYTYDAVLGDWVQTGQDQYSYNDDGTVSKIDIYAVNNGDGTKTQEIYYTYNEDGSKKVETKDLVSGKSSVTEYTYTENGDTLSESVYEVDADNNRVDVSVKDYTYDESGEMSGYTITTVDEDGNVRTTHYTSEGYAYEVAVYDTEGQLLMVMRLDPETGAEIEPTEDETTETEPTEDETTETEPTEGETTETEPTEGETTETEPAETEPVETEPVETEPVETEPVETEPVETEPAETEPVETEPVETEPTETEPAVVPEEPEEQETPEETEGTEPVAE